MKETIEKWYKKLEFPTEYDAEFYEYLSKFEPISLDIDTYDLDCEDGKKNLLSYLYMCEQAEKLYLERGISNEIIVDTLKDIVTWCENWSKIKGELYLGELAWLKHHLKMEIFKIGRLQFSMNPLMQDVPKYDFKSGENVIGIHIPRGEKLNVEDCKKSIELAKEFFAKHFPEYNYKIFTCCSWLLDDGLKEFLPPDSNILKFARLFDCVSKEEVLRLLKFIFPINTTIENLKNQQPTSSFASKIKEAVLSGKKFYEVLGVIAKN